MKISNIVGFSIISLNLILCICNFAHVNKLQKEVTELKSKLDSHLVENGEEEAECTNGEEI